MDDKQYFDQLNEHINKILNSDALKKLLVAGPGTGKTSFFEKTIKYYGGSKENYLILTFINNLEDELQKDLGELAKIYTFHGYCHFLLRRNSSLRYGLQDDFYYYPALIKLIKSDWEILNKNESPQFTKLMRNTPSEESLDFFLKIGSYYNAVGYDDSILRVYKSMNDGKNINEKYKLIIVDEYQDFNLLETAVLTHIIDSNPALVVGDDDQALYCQLRDSNPSFIRNLFNGQDFENFELPFCLRCPNTVIVVFNKIIESAKRKGLLSKRINKKFNFFPPVKEKDSKDYPKIKLIISTVQRNGANYFGRYILKELERITNDEIKESHDKNFPTVLIIGPTYYLRTLTSLFDEHGLVYEFDEAKPELSVKIEDGLKFLKRNNKSNLGWRIIIESTKPEFYSKCISSIIDNVEIYNLIPKEFVDEFIKKAESLELKEEPIVKKEINETKPIIKLVTYEGAKGLSAQHVFILGIQNGNLPRNPSVITDIEVCKFLVALTRTRKQCHILCTTNFAGKRVTPSEFIRWMGDENLNIIKIDKTYWKNIQA
jgi:superfamily I DNA/RNA helicase